MQLIKNKASSNKLKVNLFSVVLFLSYQVFSQSNGSVFGIITEKNSAIEFATISLTNKTDTLKIIKTSISDSLGRFTITGLKSQEYQLKIQLVGYDTKNISFLIDSMHQQIDLNMIQFVTNSKLLESVNIISHKDLIKKTEQGFIIKAADNISQIGGTATDLLRNTPTVVVDAEGGITIRGKSPMILINGRNSGIRSTDRIPASSIESIEIINNPGAQYDADAEGGIINITLKKTTGKGTNGSVAIGTGYGAKGRVNSSFAINHQVGKWNIGLGYDNRFAARTRKATATRTNYFIPLNYKKKSKSN